jgi:hypothetical protein
MMASSVHQDGGTENHLAKFMISGLCAWTFELFGGHYIEFLKILKQTNAGKSYADLSRQMTAQKGLIGILDGYFPWGSIQCFIKGASFGLGQSLALKYLEDKTTAFNAQVLSGSVGGCLQGMMISPLVLLKTRVMTDPSFRASGNTLTTAIVSSKLAVNLIQSEGLSVLSKGLGLFTVKRTADWTTRFLFAEMITDSYLSVKTKSSLSSASSSSSSSSQHPTSAVVLTSYEKGLCSFAGGATSAAATLPIDVLVSTVQDASKAGQKVKITEVWRNQLQQHGISGLIAFSSRGLVARLVHVGLSTALMKEITSIVYKLF